MNVKKFLIAVFLCAFSGAGYAACANPDRYSDFFEKMATANFNGKTAADSIRGLGAMGAGGVSVLFGRILLASNDAIVGDWAVSGDTDFKGYGMAACSIADMAREKNEKLQKADGDFIFTMAANVMVGAVDPDGKFTSDRGYSTGLLTSTGISGYRDKRGNFRITDVFENSSASQAGLKSGDLITEIDGTKIDKRSDADLAAELSGYTAGILKMNILSESGARKVLVRRSGVVFPDADIIFRKPYLEIAVRNISAGSVSIANEALIKYEKELKGILIDLRGAGGTDASAAAKFGGLFVGKNPVLRVFDGKDETEFVPARDASTDAPIVVVVNEGTKGAAEAFAAAIWDNRRGAVIGTPTAGESKLAKKIQLDGGGEISIHSDMVKTGLGRVIENRGFFPNVCLSAIRSDTQSHAFFANVRAGDFRPHDYNGEADAPVNKIREGCRPLKSGAAEDALTLAIGIGILSNDSVYKGVLNVPK